jgi:hypothetical protein
MFGGRFRAQRGVFLGRGGFRRRVEDVEEEDESVNPSFDEFGYANHQPDESEDQDGEEEVDDEIDETEEVEDEDEYEEDHEEGEEEVRFPIPNFLKEHVSRFSNSQVCQKLLKTI